MDERSLKEVIREEWKKLSGLTWGQRLGYVWEYYKPLMLGILGVIAVISIAVTMYRNAQIETVFQGYLINCSNLSDITEQMGQEFGDYLGGVENNQEILLSPLSYDPEDTTQYGVANQMKLTTLMAAGDVDVFIMDEETYGELQNLGAFKELSGLMTSEQMEKWEAYLHYDRDPESGEEGVYALELDTSPVLEKYQLYGGGTVYGAVMVGSSRSETGIQFFEYLMNE